MEVTDKIVLNQDRELKLYFYNSDSKFKDYETMSVKANSQFLIVGFVQEKTNNLSLDNSAMGDNMYAYVLKNEVNNELFRVDQALVNECFTKVELN